MKKSKNRQKALEMFERNKKYSLKEALEILKKFPKAKFDESVEVHISLGIDAKKTDQHLRASVVLPHGTGAGNQKIMVFTETQKAEAEKAGADFIGDEKTIEQIAKDKKIDFEVIMATPEMMPKLSKIARILGPRGLMPNPKSGTVGKDIAKLIEEVRKGRADFKTDKSGNIHQVVGKRSFNNEQLEENIKVLLETVQKNKPEKMKGRLIKSVTLTATMTPGIKVAV